MTEMPGMKKPPREAAFRYFPESEKCCGVYFPPCGLDGIEKDVEGEVVGSALVSVGSALVSVGSALVSVGSALVSVGSALVSVGKVSVGSVLVSVGSVL